MTKTRELGFEFDAEVYPLDAIQAAAYAFTDRLTVLIDRKGKGPVSVRLKPKDAAADLEALSGEFQNELLHETLRLKVSRANQKIREYIVTKALISAQVPGALPAAPAAADAAGAQACPECEKAEPASAPAAAAPPVDAELEKEIEKLLAEIEKGGAAEDPLGVTVAWEEKYGVKAEKAGKTEAPAPAEKKTAARKKAAAGGPGSRRAGTAGEDAR